MPELDPKTRKSIVIALLLTAVALVSALWLAGAVSSPEFNAERIAALDEKKVTVMELTAATALTSVAVSAVPGDATTPIADQIARLSSYLLVVTGVLMLEKFLLGIIGKVAFGALIPLACAMGIVYRFWPRRMLKRLAVRLAVFALAICCVIPASIWASDAFEEAFHLEQTVQSAAAGAQRLEEETQGDTEAGGTLGDWLAGLGDQITAGVTGAVDKAEAVLSDFIDAVAVLLIANCVIPVLVLFLFMWLARLLFSLPPDGGAPRALLPPADANARP